MATRTTPVLLGEHEGPLHERHQRSGFWKSQMESTLKPNPKKTFVYDKVSASTATNLRRDYGLDAYTVTVDGVTRLYVMYDPARVDEIKQETADRGEKRKATIAANKAAKARKAASK
jgi:hypothetical protein